MLPAAVSGDAYALSNTVDPGYLDLVVTANVANGGNWKLNGSGSWSAGSNWSSGTVPSSGTVTFAGAPSAPPSVTLDANQSVGGLLLDAVGSNGYTLAQGASGTLSLGTGTAGSIAVVSGTHAITAPLVLAGSLAVSTSSGGVLDLAGSVSESTKGSAVSIGGSGELVLSGTGSYSGGTVVSGGTLYLTSPSGIAANTKLTVTTNGTFIYDPTVAASPLAVVSGRALPAAAVVAVPEPATLPLLAAGAMLAGLGVWWRKR